jgi:hypothetical protein
METDKIIATLGVVTDELAGLIRSRALTTVAEDSICQCQQRLLDLFCELQDEQMLASALGLSNTIVTG